jgi:hypothetical protein
MKDDEDEKQKEDRYLNNCRLYIDLCDRPAFHSRQSTVPRDVDLANRPTASPAICRDACNN